MFTTFLKHRPVIIAERHNASVATYTYYLYLKNTPTDIFDFCLFEGALDTQTHLENAKNACYLYHKLVGMFLKTTQKSHLTEFMHNDLLHENPLLTQFSYSHIDIKKYPHGFGQVRNLTAHFLLSTHLSKHKTQWIAIDDKRNLIKKFALHSIEQGTAYLYKKHKNIGQITSLKQKILLEAAPIRSKYMNDKIFEFATQSRCLVLMGNRHALDIVTYTPDLADIFGYNPHNDKDESLYFYNAYVIPTRYDILPKNPQFCDYYRLLSPENTKRIKSSFNINNIYLDKLKYIFTYN